jgi:hypothetical protein
MLARGSTRCGKTRPGCHSGEVAAATDEESRIFLKIPRARFLAPLGMTARTRFSAACQAASESAQGGAEPRQLAYGTTDRESFG